MRPILASVALSGLLAAQALAQPEKYKTVRFETSPPGCHVALERLGTNPKDLGTTDKEIRLEWDDFHDPDSQSRSRTLLFSLNDYRTLPLENVEWDRISEGVVVRDRDGKPLTLAPSSPWVTVKEHWLLSLSVCSFFCLGGLTLLHRQKEAKRAQRSAQDQEQRALEEEKRQQQQRLLAEAEAHELAERNKAVQTGGGKDPWLGYKLQDQYILVEKIGEGGQAHVYKARSLETNQYVAVKMISFTPNSSNKPMAGEDLRVRHRSEIAEGLKLIHPGFVRYYSGGELQENYGYLILEYVAGNRTLKALIRPEGLPAQAVCRILKPVADALEFAHSLGIIHRDLKPENVFIDPNDQPKIGDLGLAKHYMASNNTATGTALGTAAYLSPDQFKEFKKPTPAMDQYSFGVMAYELLTGELPFTGTVIEVVMDHHQKDIPPLKNQSPAVNGVILKMLSKAPEKRYPSIKAAFQALESASGLV